MPRIAMLTSGPLNAAEDTPHIQAYFDLAGKLFDALTLDDGYLGRSSMNGEGTWGEYVVPKIFEAQKVRTVQTLSLWRDFESLYAYSYNGKHLEAIKRGKEWFDMQPFKNNVIWWVADDHYPTWAEAASRFDTLREQGASPEAFDIVHLYDVAGNPVKLDRDMVKAKAKLYK